MDISRLGDQNKHIEQHRFQSDLNPVEKSNAASSAADTPDSVQFTPSRNDRIDLSNGSFNKEIDFAQKVYSNLNAQGADNVRRARANIQNGNYDLNNPQVADKVVKGLAGDITGNSATASGAVSSSSSSEEASESAAGQNRLEEIREKVRNNQDVLNTVAQRIYKSISKI